MVSGNSRHKEMMIYQPVRAGVCSRARDANGRDHTMSMCRRFYGEPVTRLIVSVPVDVVAELDSLIAGRWPKFHPARGCRAEFIRIAIAEKLERDSQATPKWT